MEGNKTIHTSGTMMFAELSKVMDHTIQDDTYLDSLHLNGELKDKYKKKAKINVLLFQ